MYFQGEILINNHFRFDKTSEENQLRGRQKYYIIAVFSVN